MSKKNKADDMVILSRSTPGKSAEIFRTRTRPNLINQQDEWLDWNGHAYASVEDATIESELERFAKEAKTMVATVVGADDDGKPIKELQPVPFNPKPGDLYAIYDMLKRQNHKPADTMSPPCWLDSRTNPLASNIISVENGLLDIISRDLIEFDAGLFHPHRSTARLRSRRARTGLVAAIPAGSFRRGTSVARSATGNFRLHHRGRHFAASCVFSLGSATLR